MDTFDNLLTALAEITTLADAEPVGRTRNAAAWRLVAGWAREARVAAAEIVDRSRKGNDMIEKYAEKIRRLFESGAILSPVFIGMEGMGGKIVNVWDDHVEVTNGVARAMLVPLSLVAFGVPADEVTPTLDFARVMSEHRDEIVECVKTATSPLPDECVDGHLYVEGTVPQLCGRCGEQRPPIPCELDLGPE